jgi:nitrogen regulatory protein PII
MKMILAFIQPQRLERVTRALEHLPDFPGMTVSEARGFGRDKRAHTGDHLAQLTDYTKTTRLEVIAHSGQVDAIVRAIADTATTGLRDDGKVFVIPVERGRRIRTGEEGENVV